MREKTLSGVQKVLMCHTQPYLLAVQEVHDGLQDIVGFLNHAPIGWYSLTFDQGQDIPHLPHIVLDLGLETATPHTKNNTLVLAKEACCSLSGR